MFHFPFFQWSRVKWGKKMKEPLFRNLEILKKQLLFCQKIFNINICENKYTST